MYNGLEHNRGHGKAFMNFTHCYFFEDFRDFLQILVYSYILYFQVLDCRCQMGMVMKADNSSCIVSFFSALSDISFCIVCYLSCHPILIVFLPSPFIIIIIIIITIFVITIKIIGI